MRVALVHDWLTGMRGGEKVLQALCELLPTADIFTLLHRPGSASPEIEAREIRTSPLQRVPGALKYYRYFLPVMPWAVETFDLSEYDLVVSSSHCVAKGVVTRPDAAHVSYVHTPMRYAWDLWPQYFPPKGLVNRFVAPPLLTWLRTWDVTSAARVDRFVANSQFVGERIWKYYRRASTVIHPPVDTRFFAEGATDERETDDYYLIVSALVPSKRVDQAIEAFKQLDRPLKIVGEGPLYERLRAMAGPQVEFLGWIPQDELRERYQHARAVVHTAIEDFGIVALEAGSAGRPVIALGKAGSLDTVVPINPVHGARPLVEGRTKATGLFYYEQTPRALVAAVRQFEELEHTFQPETMVAHARQFDRRVFLRKMNAFLDEALHPGRGDGKEVRSARSLVETGRA